MFSYNKIIFKLISKINNQDFISKKLKKNYYKYNIFSVKNNINQIDILIKNKNIHFSVKGSIYMIAMTKWLQQMLINYENKKLQTYDIHKLCNKFIIPKNKRQEALMIISMINKIYNLK